jgi:hypothetical protein
MYDIRAFFHAESYSLFRQTILNMSVNNPELCAGLLNEISKLSEFCYLSEFYYCDIRELLSKDHVSWNVSRNTPPSEFTNEHPYHSREEWENEFSLKDDVNAFVQDCIKHRLSNETHYRDNKVEDILRSLYDRNAAKAIAYLLHHVNEETIHQFAYTFLDPERLANQASVKIIVRPIDDERNMRGNKGRYLICTLKEDDEEQVLHFTNQASCVYYLMYLIDRYKNMESIIPSLKLSNNISEFSELYHKVYDITSETLEARIHRLLFRHVTADIMRAGRERECICDIRKHLDEAFNRYNESYFPYAMTANTHLTVPRKNIVFAEGAEELLEFSFG